MRNDVWWCWPEFKSPLLTQTLARAFRPVQQTFQRAAYQIVVTDNGNE
jgi:hypothetical protein